MFDFLRLFFQQYFLNIVLIAHHDVCHASAKQGVASVKTAKGGHFCCENVKYFSPVILNNVCICPIISLLMRPLISEKTFVLLRYAAGEC